MFSIIWGYMEPETTNIDIIRRNNTINHSFAFEMIFFCIPNQSESELIGMKNIVPAHNNSSNKPKKKIYKRREVESECKRGWMWTRKKIERKIYAWNPNKKKKLLPEAHNPCQIPYAMMQQENGMEWGWGEKKNSAKHKNHRTYFPHNFEFPHAPIRTYALSEQKAHVRSIYIRRTDERTRRVRTLGLNFSTRFRPNAFWKQ